MIQKASRTWGAVLFLVIALLGIDIWTKALAHSFFKGSHLRQEDLSIWHGILGTDFSITYVSNRGAAWGWLAEWHSALLFLRIVAVIAVGIYLYRGWRQNMPLSTALPWLLVATGALGNIIDNVIYGYVVDFFLFSFWGHDFAVFNVADSIITIGVTWMILDILRTPSREELQ